SCVHLHEDGEPRWRRARIGGPHMDEGVAILQSPNRSDVEIRCRPKFAARRREGGLKKIQAIYNGKSAPITMQGLARLREKPPAQEQWEQWKEQWKTMRRTMETGGMLTSGCPTGRPAAALCAGRDQPAPEPVRMRIGMSLAAIRTDY